MLSESVKALENELRNLATSFSGRIEWKWDGRFKTALAEFPADRKDDVLGVLEQHLVSVWDSATVKDAPDTVRAIVTMLGGLMSGQLLLLSDSQKDACIFCAWWPWGNGTTISIRLAPFGKDLSAEELVELTTVFRGWFNV